MLGRCYMRRLHPFVRFAVDEKNLSRLFVVRRWMVITAGYLLCFVSIYLIRRLSTPSPTPLDHSWREAIHSFSLTTNLKLSLEHQGRRWKKLIKMAPLYKMTYFDIRGLAEPIRYLLAYGGIEFEDNRITFEQWPGLKKTTPFGKLPIIEVDGEVIHQSAAMARYFAKKLNLAGDDDWESMLCDMVVDSFTDLRMQTSAFFREKDPAVREKKKDPLFNEIIPFYLERLDKEVEKNSGHFVRGKLTWADFYIISCLETMADTLKISYLDKYPNLKALTEKVNSIPQIKEWIEKRPNTAF